jgi:hypothetical protein
MSGLPGEEISFEFSKATAKDRRIGGVVSKAALHPASVSVAAALPLAKERSRGGV